MKVNFAPGLNAGEDNDEYEYDEVTTRNKTSGGTRLVGARTAKKLEAPFVVAINTHGLVLSLTFRCSLNIRAGKRSLVHVQDL